MRPVSAISLMPGQVWPMLSVDRRIARPMVLLARQPCPMKPMPDSMPISAAIGPLTTTSRLKEPAEARI